MKYKIMMLFTFLLSFFIFTDYSFAGRQNWIKTPPPAHKITVVATPRPHKHAIWVTGHWNWNTERYVWVEGKWIDPKPGRIWVDGYWKITPKGWIWIDGCWKKK